MQPHHVNKKLISPLLFVLQEEGKGIYQRTSILIYTHIHIHRSLRYFVLLERITSFNTHSWATAQAAVQVQCLTSISCVVCVCVVNVTYCALFFFSFFQSSFLFFFCLFFSVGMSIWLCSVVVFLFFFVCWFLFFLGRGEVLVAGYSTSSRWWVSGHVAGVL